MPILNDMVRKFIQLRHNRW